MSTQKTHSQCVACLELLPPGTKVCPHCHTEQKIRPPVRSVITWIGSLVAVISLVLGVVALNVAVKQWREMRVSVEQLVAGADKALQAGEYRLARDGYDLAAQTDPTSARLREGQSHLAQVWLGEMLGNLREGESYRGFAKDLLPELYKGLAGKSDKAASVIWARIGWAQHLAQLSRERLRLDPLKFQQINDVYDRAVALDEESIYTPVYRAYLHIDGRSDIDIAEHLFLAALKAAEREEARASETYQWVRRMQLNSVLSRMAAGVAGPSHDVERGLFLLRAINSMRLKGEPLPADNILDQLLGFYRSSSRADHIGEILAALPVSEHRATYNWVLNSAVGALWLDRDNNIPALLLFKALLEEHDNPDLALTLYRQIYEFDKVHRTLAARIDEGILRMSGTQPPRMVKQMGRTYNNDPMPITADVYTFHLDSLLQFNTGYIPTNSEAAFAWFMDRENIDPRPPGDVLGDMVRVRDRLLNDFQEFHQEVDAHGYSLAQSAWTEIWLTRNMLKAHHLVTAYSLDMSLYDQTLAELADAQSICDQWIPAWIFELRTALYSKRGFSNDITLAGEQLRHYVETKVAYGGALDWSRVKSHPDFAALRQTAQYTEIMRGR